MIGNYVAHSDIVALEPSLEDERYNEEIDFGSKIEQAKRILISDYKNNGKEIKKIGTALSIPLDGTSSTEDNIERLRVVIKTTSVTDIAVLALSGKNSSSDDWDVIKDMYEQIQDARDEAKDPYGYRGLSRRDFMG